MSLKGNRTNNIQKMKGVINGAGKVLEQKIVNTIEENYMPYAISVIVSRAIPEIDGFKPSHRKLLYTMYKMGLLTSSRTKSANIVGQTMKLNPHGDSAIYDTMVRLSRGYEALLHPYIDSKGNFGKFYSRDMACAASRYTEAKLDSICIELFKDIDKNTVDFADNYDNTLKEPTLLPASFPSILVNANTGIAVGMASSICPFNLKEICNTTIALINDPEHDISTTLLAPDFPGGGQIIYNSESINNIYKTGRGGIKIRCKYTYDSQENCIDIASIPPTTTSEAIIEKIIDLVKNSKIKDISDIRDETGIDGLKITIDLKRNVDPNKLMKKLFKMTPLEDTFSCNFNVLISGVPKVMGVKQILNEWVTFRTECVKRRTYYDFDKKSKKLHLLKGLEKILFDIDKAVKIVRETEEESEVVPNLMIGFGIDETQAEYVAEIKLRHLNREYILNKTKEITNLKDEINELKEILQSKKRIQEIIVMELKEIAKKYGKSRKSLILYNDELENEEIEDEDPDYQVTLFFTKGGYLKKVTPQSLRMSSEHKLKDNDKILQMIETTNNTDLLFFTNTFKAYKTKLSEFKATKISLLGDFVPAKLLMDENEKIVYMANTRDYSGFMVFFFQNGKVAKVSMSAYKTKTNRKKLTNAYNDKSPLVKAFYITEDCDFILTSNLGKMLIMNTASILKKTTKNTIGVAVMLLKKGNRVLDVKRYVDGDLTNPIRYRTKTLPSTGTMPKASEQKLDQLKIE